MWRLALVCFILPPAKTDSSAIQASLDLGGETNQLLQTVFTKLELLMDKNETTKISQGHTELAAALLRQAPVITLKGNITDPSRKFTISFTIKASQILDRGQDDDEDDDEDDWDERNWRGGGGMFQPFVEVVEPYVFNFAELIFHGVLSSVIGKFLDSTTLVGDGRLV